MVIIFLARLLLVASDRNAVARRIYSIWFRRRFLAMDLQFGFLGNIEQSAESSC